MLVVKNDNPPLNAIIIASNVAETTVTVLDVMVR